MGTHADGFVATRPKGVIEAAIYEDGRRQIGQ